MSHRIGALLAMIMAPLASAGVAGRFMPDVQETGPGGRFAVTVRLENLAGSDVRAVQLFVGYDAALLRAESVVWPAGGILTEGRFATGIYDGLSSPLYPLWRDGQDVDVVSVSAHAAAGASVPAAGTLCVIEFSVVEAVAPQAVFVLDPGPYWTFSGALNSQGWSVPVAWTLGTVNVSAVPPVRNLACVQNGGDVVLTWDAPGGQVDAIDVSRGGTLVQRIGGELTTFRERSVPLGAHRYTVASVAGGVTGPRVPCDVHLRIAGPRGLACFFTGDGVRLTWELPFTYAYLELRRDGRVIAQPAGDVVSYDDRDVAGGTASVAYQLVGVLGGYASVPALCTVQWSDSEGWFLRGDTNMDGARQISDAVLLLRYLFGSATLNCLDAGDFDDNGKLQISDAIALLAYLFAGGFPPPPPHLEPGPDPTPDALSCAEGLDLR